MRATQRIQLGALVPSGMKMPERNSSGRMVALTIAGEASALGITVVMANPRAQKLPAPTTSMTRKWTSVMPVGTEAW